MAWTAPITWVAGGVPTASLLNAQIRDNLLETMPAKATLDGSIFVATGANAITERYVDMARVETLQTTTSTSYANLATVGPEVTLQHGTAAFVLTGCTMFNSGTDNSSFMSWACSGSSNRAAFDGIAIQQDGVNASERCSSGMVDLFTGMTPGTSTFTAKYRVSAGTGSFLSRFIAVIPIA